MKCGLNDGKLYDAVIVGIDPVGDVALIQLLGRDDFPVAEIADSDQVRVGDWCFASGNPFLLADDFTPTITYGHRLGRSPLSVPGRHAAGVHRLHVRPTRRSTPATRAGRCSMRRDG